MSVDALTDSSDSFSESSMNEEDVLGCDLSEKFFSKKEAPSKVSAAFLHKNFEKLFSQPKSIALVHAYFPSLKTDKSSSLPDDFHLDLHSFSRSRYYDLKRPELDRGEIGFINGILTDFHEAEQHATYLSSLTQGHNIHGVYKTSRPLNLELFESFSGLNTSPVFLLQNQWRSFFSQHPDLKYLQICHSQGALHVKHALIGLEEEERKKLIIVAIAPQVLIPSSLCYSADNYVSRHDFIPFLCSKECKEGSSNKVHILHPAPKSPMWDHDFESPTYRESLKIHIENYMKHPEGFANKSLSPILHA